MFYLRFVMIQLLFVTYALAHDDEHPELDGWYRDLKSKGLALCCDGSDATHLSDVDWESHNGHYRVRLNDEWVDVPESAVVKGPNRDGRTLVWPFYKNGRPAIRCFMPGSMT